MNSGTKPKQGKLVTVKRCLEGVAKGIWVLELECGHVRYTTSKYKVEAGGMVECTGLVRHDKMTDPCI